MLHETKEGIAPPRVALVWPLVAGIILVALLFAEVGAKGCNQPIGVDQQVLTRQQHKVAMAGFARDHGFVLLNLGDPLPGSQVFLACSKASGLLYTGVLSFKGDPEWSHLGEYLASCPGR